MYVHVDIQFILGFKSPFEEDRTSVSNRIGFAMSVEQYAKLALLGTTNYKNGVCMMHTHNNKWFHMTTKVILHNEDPNEKQK